MMTRLGGNQNRDRKKSQMKTPKAGKDNSMSNEFRQLLAKTLQINIELQG